MHEILRNFPGFQLDFWNTSFKSGCDCTKNNAAAQFKCDTEDNNFECLKRGNKITEKHNKEFPKQL